MKSQKYTVTGMTCSACSAHVEKSVRKIQGMNEVTVNLLTNSMQVSYDEALCNEQMIIEAVEKAGYGAKPEGSRERNGRNQEGREALKGRKQNALFSSRHRMKLKNLMNL